MDTVNVLMSTYNGEKYLKEQIESILKQRNVNIMLTIRDDGSTDGTVGIIKHYCEKFNTKIKFFLGDNIGYQKSFLQLLCIAETADYYSFADQDDVWYENKLSYAIKNIKTLDDRIALYASDLTLVNENLEKIDTWKKPYAISDIKSYYTRSRIAGCTFLFTHDLKEIASRFAKDVMNDSFAPDHDFVVGNCALACGSIYIDNHSYILHRRLENSVTSGGNGLLKRIKTEWGILFHNTNFHTKMAILTLKLCMEEMKPDAISFLTAVSIYNKSFKNKCRLLFYKGRTSHILFCDIEQFVKILIGNY